MWYLVLANLVLIIHVAFIAFVILGGLLALHRRWTVWFHLPAAVWGMLVEFMDWPCPLTELEVKWLQEAGGAGYAGGFIEHYVMRLIYPIGLTPAVQWLLGFGVIAANGVAYTLVWRKWRRSTENGSRWSISPSNQQHLTSRRIPMYRKLLVPLDGSELSECSLIHARMIAAGSKDIKVVLLRVLETSHLPSAVLAEIGTEAAKSMVEKDRELSIQYLAQKAKGLEDIGIIVETTILEGNPAAVILQYSKKENIDLIVMSTHGDTGIVRFMLGSVADKVIRHSVAPVLLVAPSSCRQH